MRRAPVLAVGALVAVLFAAWAVGGEGPADPPPSGTVGDLFGINEAIAIPAARAAQLDATARDALLDERIALTRALGVRHVRVHSASWPHVNFTNRDRAEMDAYFAKVLGAGLDPLVMIGPWPGNAPAARTDHYVPNDLAGYAAWVTATVERYDGDGTDDAPGVGAGVHTWEVDNEPDLHATTPPRGSKAPVGDFETVEEYAKVAAVTRDAILAADPDALVLPAGLLAPAGPRTKAYATALWGTPSFAAAFAATNVHAYPRDPLAVWDGEDRVEALAPGRARWLTEVSIGDEGGEGPQAAFLADLYLDALRRGVARVYWHSLREPPLRPGMREGPHPSEGNHLYAGEPPHPKLAGLVLQRMIAVWGEVPRADVRTVEAPGARALRVGEDLVVWGGAADVAVTAPAGELAAERLVPDAPDGAAIGDGGPVWTLGRLPVQDSRVHVDAAAGPVRVVRAFPRSR